MILSSGIAIPIWAYAFSFSKIDVQDLGEHLHAEGAPSRAESRKRQLESPIIHPDYKDL